MPECRHGFGDGQCPASPSGHPCPPGGAQAGHSAVPAGWEPQGGCPPHPCPPTQAPGCPPPHAVASLPSSPNCPLKTHPHPRPPAASTCPLTPPHAPVSAPPCSPVLPSTLLMLPSVLPCAPLCAPLTALRAPLSAPSHRSSCSPHCSPCSPQCSPAFPSTCFLPFHLSTQPGLLPGVVSLVTCPRTGEVVSGRCVCPCLPARHPPSP